MKFAPIVLALVVICVTGFAIPPQPLLNRTEAVPISIDDLALPIENPNDFEESFAPPAISNLNGKQLRLIGKIELPEPSETCGVVFFGDTRREPKEILDEGIFPQRGIRLTFNKTQGKLDQFVGAVVELRGRLVIEPRYGNGILVQVYRIEDATIDFGKQEEGFTNSRDVMYTELSMMMKC